jgi:hypothetical protein
MLYANLKHVDDLAVFIIVWATKPLINHFSCAAEAKNYPLSYQSSFN